MNNYPFQILLAARPFADDDDCFAAAVAAVEAAYPDSKGYDFEPRWGDDDRETIALDVSAAVYAEWSRDGEPSTV